ncbi:reverse transcriptase domain-containing protein [Tanacetum coccineum]
MCQNPAIKLMLFPFSLAGAACRWLEKEPPRSITTWDDLISKFINDFFPPSRTTNLRNEISNFQQKFDESFHEAWDRYKDLLRACPHHGFTELHQLDTFYNALNPADQDSLNSIAGGNLLERSTQDVLTIIENKSKCLTADGNTFPEYRDNIQGYVAAATGNYNQGNNFNQNPTYQAPIQQNQSVPLSELEKIKKMNDVNMKAMQAQINNVKNELRNEMQSSIQAVMSNQTNELLNMMASFFQMNSASTSGSGSLPCNTVAKPKGELKAIITRSGLVLGGPTVPMPSSFINSEEDERVEETLTGPKHGEYTIKVPPPQVKKAKPPSQGNFMIHQRDPRYPHIPYPSRMNQEKNQDKDEVQIHKIWHMFKQLHINISIADALILILKTARALIDVHREEMILRDGNESLTLNMRHDTSSYSNEPYQESINMINVYNVSHEEILKDLFATSHPSGNATSSLTSLTNLTSLEVKDGIS